MKCVAKMQSPFDIYKHPSLTQRLPDIAEVPMHHNHDQYASCQMFCTRHPTDHHEQDSRCKSSRASKEPNRTSMMTPSHIIVKHSQPHAHRATKLILSFFIAGVLFVSFIAYILVSLTYTQAILLERVSLLEDRLSEADKSCRCGMETGGESRQKITNGERRNNKFAYLMTRGHEKFLQGEPESKPDVDLNHPLHELKEVLDTVTPEIHPKILIKLKDARSTSVPPEISESSTPTSDVSPKWTSAISQRDETESRGRYRRGGKKRGRSQSEEPRGRAATRTRDPDRNSTEIRGVHFQANLNRTTTIGVAGWVPYWALSSSLLKADHLNDIKSEFRLSARGNVTVRTPGLYYVYSQMMYYDPNEYIGHSIVVDGVEAFTCIAPISEQTSKYKTCFIGGLVYIPPRAKVAIKMLYTPRRVCLFEDTSYFGMFRVT